LMLNPTFMSGPICWCPHNAPVTKLVEETTMMVEELLLKMTYPKHTTAMGDGLKYCPPNEDATFIITAKDEEGNPLDSGGDVFVVESKETEIKASVVDQKNGSYQVSYSQGGVKEGDLFYLAINLHGFPISGSPFHISARHLLLKVASTDNLAADWLDPAVAKMSDIQRARLHLRLCDTDGSEIYKGTGVTKCPWSERNITAPGRQNCDEQHTNAIYLDNGDWLLIMGKHTYAKNNYSWDIYRPYTINIIEGGEQRTWEDFKQRRRMVITANAPNTAGWSVPENRISFSNSGFFVTVYGNWPKFNGTFEIFYEPL